MHELCSGICCRDSQVAGSNGVDLIRQILLHLALVHIGVSRAVDDSVGLYLSGKLQYLIHLGDIQLCHIGIYQFILGTACILLIHCPSHLSVASCHNNLFHFFLLFC